MRRPAYCTAKGDDEPCLASDVVLRLAGGSLAKLERQAIERRLDECEVCRRFVAEVLRQEQDSQTEGAAAAEPGAATTEPGAAPAPAPVRPPLRLPVPGQRVDRYVIERPLGAGGMGLVSVARDEELKRRVVIKLVRPDLISSQPPERGETLEARLIREAQALARLSHPCVVSIFDIGRYDGQVFFAMEFVEGVDLATYLQDEKRAPLDILGKFRQAGVGLGAAHRAGVVHRDFKPANVLVGDHGVVKVADFGLARGVADPMSTATLPGRGPAGRPRRSSMLDAAITKVDSTVGTPAYMAPEQIAGEGVDARSDQFAFAVALVDALLGQSPAARLVHPQTASDADFAILDRALAGVGAPPHHRAALLRALAQEPAERFATIEELLGQLGDPTPAGSSPGFLPPQLQPPTPQPYPIPPSPAPPPPPGYASGPSPQRPAPQLAPPQLPRRRGRLLALGLAAGLGAAAVAGWVVLSSERGASDDNGSCAARRQAITAAFPAARRQQLIDAVAVPDAAPFERWTAAAAATGLEQRVAALAAAHEAQCQSPAPAASSPPCQLTSAAELELLLAAPRTADELFAAAGALALCDAAPPLPSLADPSARPELNAIVAALEAGPLAEAQARAEALAAKLSPRAPITSAEAYRLAALAAALALSGKDEEELTARSSADAERAGDDGRRAQALLLELDAALLRFDAPRVEQLGELLRSLAARRGNQPRDRAEVEAIIAAAHDRLGRYLTSADQWRQVNSLATTAGERGLVARAALGEATAQLQAGQNVEPSRRVLRQLLEQAEELRDAGAAAVWSLAVASAVALDEPVSEAMARQAAELRAAGRDVSAADIRLRAAAAATLPGDDQRYGWLASSIETADAQGRHREAAELALEHARRRVAAAVAAATPPSGIPQATAGSLAEAAEAAEAALRRVTSLLLRNWSPDARRTALELSLRLALLESELFERGLRTGTSTSSPLTRSLYQSLPGDSLLRADAAWRHALHGRSSRYLTNDEDLELAIPLWQKLGQRERAATAAWWIASRAITGKKRARQHAQLALELYRQLGESNHAEAISAVEDWLAATPQD